MELDLKFRSACRIIYLFEVGGKAGKNTCKEFEFKSLTKGL